VLATEAGRVADMLTIPGEGDEKRRMGKRRTEIGGPNEDIAQDILVHGQVTIIFVVSVGLSVCLSVCLCRVFLSRL